MNWFLRRFLMVGLSGIAMILALTFTVGSPLAANPSVDPPVLDKFIYLPVISAPSTSVAGKIVNGGIPVVDNEVILTGNQDTYFQRTDSTGAYLFSEVNPLQPGNFYIAQYRYQGGNTLWFWQTGRITELNIGGYVTIPTFDVAGVTLIEPAANAAVTLPHTFRWTPRPGNPDETYRFVVYDMVSNRKFTSTPVGYTGEYTLQPEDLLGFSPESFFAWYIRIEKADGSYGESDGRRVRLTVP